MLNSEQLKTVDAELKMYDSFISNYKDEEIVSLREVIESTHDLICMLYNDDLEQEIKDGGTIAAGKIIDKCRDLIDCDVEDMYSISFIMMVELTKKLIVSELSMHLDAVDQGGVH